MVGFEVFATHRQDGPKRNMGELLLAALARPARAFNRIDIEREAMVCHCDLLPIELQLGNSAHGA
jgi:hypothetical protein